MLPCAVTANDYKNICLYASTVNLIPLPRLYGSLCLSFSKIIINWILREFSGNGQWAKENPINFSNVMFQISEGP